ncbi:MAG: dihydroorotate dehydrogenase-like protein [Marinilabiliaceae bacterium]|nr:dihydroorotate dehydrogenase-like protein [Marinilabiliaceae bacterium]
MSDLSVHYLGIRLKNPIIVSSSGLTNSISKIERLVDAGAGAIVLKSLFEEQINQDISNEIYKSEGFDYPEALDYVKGYVRENDISSYLQLIKEAKSRFDVPIIASVNCYSVNEWVDFAKQIENAGADALELNVFVVNTDKNSIAIEYEQIYYDVLSNVKNVISIPVAMKLGSYFSNLVSVVNRLNISGAKGVVLFNRFYEPDVDINNMTLTSADVFSTPSDYQKTLRWVAIVSSKVNGVDVSASTGIHSAESVIKQILVGAKTVQVCSAVYKNGPKIITKMIEDIEIWMSQKHISSLSSVCGKLNYNSISEPYLFERAQFMKYFSNLE